MALDPRHVGNPSCFGGTQEGSYDEWRFQPVACLTAVHPRVGDVADDVARRTTPSHAVRSQCVLHEEKTVALDHGHTEP